MEMTRAVIERVQTDDTIRADQSDVTIIQHGQASCGLQGDQQSSYVTHKGSLSVPVLLCNRRGQSVSNRFLLNHKMTVCQ